MLHLDRLNDLVRRSGLSQEELGKAIGVSRHTIIRYLSGSSSPTIDNLVGMVKVLDCSISYLFGETDTVNATDQRLKKLENDVDYLHRIYIELKNNMQK